MNRTFRASAIASIIALAGCQPPAADNYVERGDDAGPRSTTPLPVFDPMDDPDVEGALWAAVPGGKRLVYGKPGETPLFAIACLMDSPEPRLQLTRYAPADEGAKAFMALVGNSHVARLKVDATPAGNGFLWQGETPLSNERLEALTGARALEATVPGAGTLKLNASTLPGQLIEACRDEAEPEVSDLPDPSEDPA